MKTIGVFTSGGDSPGMNACIRAVVRSAIFHKKKVIGIMRGYDGMIQNNMAELNSRSVSNIIHRGGTILKTARSKDFMTDRGMKTAYENVKKNKIDALVAIGGDGTFRGAVEFNTKYDIPFIGIPGTIDNDLMGTDFTLGFDTAVNTAIEAIDKIRDTAASHNRLFFIEVMGRDSGYLALWAGVAGGAEDILLPESKTNVADLVNKLEEGVKKGKESSIVVVAEGDEGGGAMKIAEEVKKKFNYDTRVSILGHIQRGGTPTACDRILGTKFGVFAVESLLKGETDKMTGIQKNQLVLVDLKKAIKHHSPLDKHLIRYSRFLSI
ncbi:MAG TPA: 6-phosphofructokinase [Bacteroidia bacterium]|nr:6-phosphofructokinase [Bacteroidia bacterium]HNU33022.1 6-phosphofructokinase [Bacteroidia bacterium]